MTRKELKNLLQSTDKIRSGAMKKINYINKDFEKSANLTTQPGSQNTIGMNTNALNEETR